MTTTADISLRAEDMTLWAVGKSCGHFCGNIWIWPPVAGLHYAPFGRLRNTLMSAAGASAAESAAHMGPKAAPVTKPDPVVHILDTRGT